VPHLGHLDNSPHGLKPGTPLSLPLWLAEMLALASSSSTGPDGEILQRPVLPVRFSPLQGGERT
jgi:hypothetical protein